MPKTNRDFKNRTQNLGLNVITYSVSTDLSTTLAALQNTGASIHYLIEENGNETVKLDEKTQVSFCCGKSKFRDKPSVNEYSISIMLMNDAQSPFKKEQIDTLIARLKSIKEAFPDLDLKKDIVGLGEVAVETNSSSPRHIAPGKFFPWQQLAEQDFGLFIPTSSEEKAKTCVSPASSELEIKALQENLQSYGYAIEASGKYDDATKAWVTRFNQRYVPDPTQAIDTSIWSKASQISLDHIQQYVNAKTNGATQVAFSPGSLFNKPTAPAANTDEVSVQTASLSMK